jgi:hypothetical protein
MSQGKVWPLQARSYFILFLSSASSRLARFLSTSFLEKKPYKKKMSGLQLEIRFNH